MTVSSRALQALCAAVVCVLSTYPAAALCAALFRFPFPLGGYTSGFSAVPLSVVAVTVYGCLGGFLVQAVIGAGAGLWAGTRSERRGKSAWTSCLWAAAGASLPGVLLLATLDWFIGPW